MVSLICGTVKDLLAVQETWILGDPGSGRSSGEGNGYPLQYSCLQNPHGQRLATVYGAAMSWTRLKD